MLRWKIWMLMVVGLLAVQPLHAQLAASETAFHQGAQLFINEQFEEALDVVNRALLRDPDNKKLQALREQLEKKNEEQEQQQKQEQQQGENGEQDQEQQEQQGEQQQQDQQGQENQGEPQDQQQQQDQQGEQEGEQQQGEQEQEQQPGEEGKEEKEQEVDGDPEGGEQNEEGEAMPASEEELRKRLEEMGLTPQKAQMILDAMQANEMQYLQQMKRQSSRPHNSSQPDW